MERNKTICLNMIVKNESHVIKRCLDSIKHLIDTWLIVDTGSTDGTQQIIKEHLKDIPGELHERPWVNFGHNRNEAMHLALGKADYLLFIDADDRLVFTEKFTLPKHLTADIYSIIQREKYGLTFREHHTTFLVKNGKFEWKGVLHEYLKSKDDKKITMELVTGVFNEYLNDGNRSKNPNKVAEDIALLKQAFQDDPKDSRSVFYLARTYWSIKDYSSALIYFKKRAKMEGDPMEVYHSLLYTGLAEQQLQKPSEVFLKSYSTAFLFRPTRLEAIYEIARYYTLSENYFIGYLILKYALTIPQTKDNLFVEAWVDDWGTRLFFFVCANQIGKHEEARNALKNLLANPRLPSEVRTSFALEDWGKKFKLTFPTSQYA